MHRMTGALEFSQPSGRAEISQCTDTAHKRANAVKRIGGFIVLATALLGWGEDLGAAWFQVYADSTLTYYVDPDSARRVGARVRLSDLIDYKKTQITTGLSPYLSMQTQSEFDCEQELTRWLYASFHRGNMGSGALVQLAANPYPDEHWLSIAPATLGEIRWTFACIQLRW